MSNVEEIILAIEALPKDELPHLFRWLEEKDCQEWEKQLEADSAAGKLDFLIDEVHSKRTLGRLSSL
jgi:hypothetical protein